MRLGRIASIVILVVLAAAPAPEPSAEAAARRLMAAAVDLQHAGRNREAIEQLSQVLAMKALSRTDTARAFYDRGVAYDNLKNMPAAIADYSAALQVDGCLAAALNNRANVYRRAGRFAEAKRDYRAALKCPGVPPEYPYYGLGFIAGQEGDTGAAENYLRKSLAANPAFAPAVKKLAALTDANEIPRPASQPYSNLGGNGPPATRAPEGKGRMLVQLGAFKDREFALKAWARIAAAAEGVLDGFEPIAVPVDLPGKGRLWRLRVSVRDKAAAQDLCRALIRRGQDCLAATR